MPGDTIAPAISREGGPLETVGAVLTSGGTLPAQFVMPVMIFRNP